MLEVRNLFKALNGNEILKNINLRFETGVYGLLGANGAGKTTAIKLICGLYFPTNGDVLINEKKSSDIPSECYFNLFSTVFQDYSFMPMTIAENICACANYDKEKLYLAFEKAGILEKIKSLIKKENTLFK